MGLVFFYEKWKRDGFHLSLNVDTVTDWLSIVPKYVSASLNASLSAPTLFIYFTKKV